MMQPGMMTPGMMMPPQGQIVVEEHINIEKKVEIKVAFWNRQSVVKRVRYAMCCGGITTCCAGLLMMIMIILAASSAQVEASGIMQIKSDWQVQPYTQMYVASVCAPNDITLWSKYMAGSQRECYKYETRTVTTSNRRLQSGSSSSSSRSSTTTKTEQVCVQWAPGFAGVTQTNIYGYKVCGRRGGITFKDVARPNDKNQCPKGTKPCSTQTTADQTLCYADTNQCPITFAQFIAGPQLS